MQEEYIEISEDAMQFIKNVSKTILDGKSRIESFATGLSFEYQHDANQFIKELKEMIKPWKHDDLVFNLVFRKMDIYEDMNIYSVVIHVFKKEDEDLIKPYLPLRYIQICPMASTGILDPSDPDNRFMSALHKNMFVIGTGITEHKYKSMTVQYRKGDTAEQINNAISDIEDIAKDFGLKIYTKVFVKRAKVKYYIYQTMSPELETIIKRSNTLVVV